MALFNRPIRLLLLGLLFSLFVYVAYTNYILPDIANVEDSSPSDVISRFPYPPFKRPKSFPPTYNYRWTWSAPAKGVRHPNNKFKAVLMTFVRNDELLKLRLTIRSLEDSFNRNYNYPYVILSDQELTDEFKVKAAAMTKATVLFPDIPDELWGYPSHTDQKRAARARDAMKDIIFGGSEDYRFQSRFMSGPVFDHPALKEFDYYWRFESGSEYLCSLEFDPFQFMYDNDKKISFSISLFEYNETIPTIWAEVKKFIEANNQFVVGDKKGGALNFVKTEDGGYNTCHFWTNFQIASLGFFRSEGYKAFFDHLDKANGIFYERWGDPVIHTLAAAVLLRKDEIHFWEDIGYITVQPFTHCPMNKNGLPGAKLGDGGQGWKRCACKPSDSFDFNGYSCLRHWQTA